jgi:hypothetical protein
MNLRTEITARLNGHPLYSQEKSQNPIVYCKLFSPFMGAQWYLTEFDGEDICFGYVTGMAHDEWGYISITELESVCFSPNFALIECDLSFTPTAWSELFPGRSS